MSRFDPLARPNVVRALSAEDVEGGLKLYTFPDGFRCYSHSSEIETLLIYNEIFVQQEYLGTTLSLEECRYVFDVGANIGLFTIFAKLKKPNLVVHAFEPIKETYAVLVKNVELHGLTNVYLHNYALGTQNHSQHSMTFYPNAAGNATAHPETKDALKDIIGYETTDYLFQSSHVQLVTVRTLSDVMDEVGVSTVDLLKIDTESDELAILHGIADTHFPNIRQIAAEIHSDALLAETRQLLTTKGFDVVSEAGIATNHNLYAVRKASSR
ncbi:MAG TPA: FkbM family methyltransferase [Herpetosiphonaceae bacterium]